jgi:hypothetical protein
VGGGVEGGEHRTRRLRVEAEVGVLLDGVRVPAGRVGDVGRVEGIKERVWQVGVVEQCQLDSRSVPVWFWGRMTRANTVLPHAPSPTAWSRRVWPASLVGSSTAAGWEPVAVMRAMNARWPPLSKKPRTAKGRYDREVLTGPPNYR